jgi:predicted transposase YbfD/YdcC
LASLSGIDSFSGFEDFVEMHFEELSQHFDLSGGVPSHDTYRRLWNEISPTQFQSCFMEFVEFLKQSSSEIISIDGKAIRNSGHENPLHIVSAWCHNNQMVFAQEKVHEKSNETTAIPEVLKKLSLENKIITIDAIGAQKLICQQILDGNGDYVIALKGNQKTLHEDVQLFLEDEQNYEFRNENNETWTNRTTTCGCKS